MELWQIIVIALFGAAFGYNMYHQGIKQGAELCVAKLHEEKIISFDNAGNIRPNPVSYTHLTLPTTPYV